LFGEAATAATGIAGRCGPDGSGEPVVHAVPFPRHHSGVWLPASTAKTSTRDGPDAIAQTPSAGIDPFGGRRVGAPRSDPLADHRQTPFPAPAAKTSSRSGAELQALGGPARPPAIVKVFISFLPSSLQRWLALCDARALFR
jgi:hypothetical protein